MNVVRVNMMKKCLVLISLLAAPALCFPESRVVNGTDAKKLEFPFIVSLRSSGSHHCGGTIIAPKWILTAAHCVAHERYPLRLTIQFSVLTINATGPNIAPIKRIIVHEGYNWREWFANDIALVELRGKLVFNYKSLAPVVLPEPNFEIAQVPEGEAGVLAGWGYNSTYSWVQEKLQKVDLKIYSDEECLRRHPNRTTIHQICAGVDEGGKGQCSGDSGGPLVYKGRIQLGIVSWSIKPCATYPFLGVYTKVSHYVDWIYQKIQESESKKGSEI